MFDASEFRKSLGPDHISETDNSLYNRTHEPVERDPREIKRPNTGHEVPHKSEPTRHLTIKPLWAPNRTAKTDGPDDNSAQAIDPEIRRMIAVETAVLAIVNSSLAIGEIHPSDWAPNTGIAPLYEITGVGHTARK